MWFGVKVAVGLDHRSQRTSGPVSTGMGDHVPVQFPVPNIYLATCSATQVNSTWLSFRGKVQ